jgi:hypothetical protein
MPHRQRVATTPTPEEAARRNFAMSVAERRRKQLRLTHAAVAERTGLHRNSVRAFFIEQRWPYPDNRRKFELALEWPEGTLDSITQDSPEVSDPAITQSDEPRKIRSSASGLIHTVGADAWDTLDAAEQAEAIAEAELAFIRAVNRLRRRD